LVGPVVDQVAALAQALQIARPIISRVVIEVGGCEDDTGLPQPGCLFDIGPGCGPTVAVAPSWVSCVIPATIRQSSEWFRHAAGRNPGSCRRARSNRTLRLVCGQSIG
jgi:hypothetical protein